jgi:hypothetical protein
MNNNSRLCFGPAHRVQNTGPTRGVQVVDVKRSETCLKLSEELSIAASC